eukprot:9388920-Pyramimonas_sp.AAC.1
MEVDNELPTHYVTNESQPKLAQIDRVLVSMPSWVALQQHFTAAAADKPEDFHEKGISDHAPVAISFVARSHAAAEEQKIPVHFFRDP